MAQTDSQPVLYLIDGSSYVFRAYHALPHLSTRTGEPTNAVLGFVNMLLKTLRDGAPTHVAVAFDTKAPTFRHERFPEYKANRVSPPEDLRPQIPRIHEIVEAMNLPLVELPGWEADDLIGTLAERAAERGWRVVMVTGDKDFMQLVRPGIRMYDGMRDRWFDDAEVEEKFGVGPSRVIDVLALTGDTSDNVPGVRGIGEKTAGPLISTHGSLEALYEHLDEVKGAAKKKLEAGRDQAFLSKELVTIRCDAPVDVDLDALARREPDTDRLRRLFTDLEFHKLARELTPATTLSDEHYQVVSDAAGLRDLTQALADAPAIALHLCLDDPAPMRGRIVGLGFAGTEGHAHYVPVGHAYIGAPAQLPLEDVLEALRPQLEDPDRPKWVADFKDAHLVLARHGVRLAGVTGDPLVFDYLLDPGGTRSSLGSLSQTELGHTPPPLEELTGKGRSKEPLERVTVERLAPWGCEHADLVLRLTARLRPRVEEAGLWPVWEDLERPLGAVLSEMEQAGVRVDTARLEALSEELADRAAEVEARIYELAGRKFLINSTKQLAEVLFQDLALRVVKRTKTGPSTDVTVLEALALEHPLPQAILDYRHLTKLKGTYVDALPGLVHPETGRIHTRLSQTTAATGRLASSDPNLQNIPIRTDEGRRIREAFVADAGHLLVSADYSQIELRILAHLAKDEAFAAAFREGQDIHARTASELLGVPLDGVTAEHRRIAKAINFGIVYGMSAFRLARDLGIERREAQLYIDHYFERHAGVAAWLEQTVAEAHEKGEVRTLFGRRRLLPDLASRNKQVRAAAERTAINTPIQGTAADIIKLAMLKVHEGLGAVCDRARLILQVHDELLVEVPEADAPKVAAWVGETMEGAIALDVPLKVDVGVGGSWADAH